MSIPALGKDGIIIMSLLSSALTGIVSITAAYIGVNKMIAKDWSSIREELKVSNMYFENATDEYEKKVAEMLRKDATERSLRYVGYVGSNMEGIQKLPQNNCPIAFLSTFLIVTIFGLSINSEGMSAWFTLLIAAGAGVLTCLVIWFLQTHCCCKSALRLVYRRDCELDKYYQSKFTNRIKW